jgi:hypothetical protein
MLFCHMCSSTQQPLELLSQMLGSSFGSVIEMPLLTSHDSEAFAAQVKSSQKVLGQK